MATKTSAFLLPLANLRGAAIQNQVFPVTAFGTKAWLPFDHHS
jgi:hypothetical protein